MILQKNVSLKKLNSWLVGGSADLFCAPRSVEELTEALREQSKYVLLAGGTNVLVADGGVRGLVIHLAKLTGIEIGSTSESVSMVCLAGTPKAEVLRHLLKFKLEAALFMAGIPGTVGGGVAMNAGVGEQITPREFVEIVDWVEVLETPSLEIKRYQRSDLTWDYRHSAGWQEGIITRVALKFANEPHADILERVKAANRVRAHKQPLELPSCGSVFRNPPGDKAGRLVEAAGLKGFSIGGARVSEKHANFIVNGGGATAKEIAEVISHVQQVVEEKFSVKLKTEVVWL